VIRIAPFAISNFDFARVMGVFDPTVSVPATEPFLRRPAVEGPSRSEGDGKGSTSVKIRSPNK
jgi:hypothetical protein